MSRSDELYRILGIDRRASADDIRRAYKAQALKYHPDKNPDNRQDAEVRFKQISEAYEVLSNPDARRQYDASGTAGGPSFSQQSRRGSSGGMGHDHMFNGGFQFHDPFEIFRQMFNDMDRDNGMGMGDPFAGFHGMPRQQRSIFTGFGGGPGMGFGFSGLGDDIFSGLGGTTGGVSSFQSFSSSSSSFGGGGGGATSVSSTTTIRNGEKVTRTVRRVTQRDGTVTEDVDEKVERLPGALPGQDQQQRLPIQSQQQLDHWNRRF